MKKIVIAVDGTKATREVFDKTAHICKCIGPEEVLLVYVEKFEGPSLLDDMLGDAEMATLRQVLEGTEYKEALDRKAETVLSHYHKVLTERPPYPAVRKVLRSGHPADEILAVAKEEAADLIIIGSRGKRVSQLFMGSVSREVANQAEVPVLIVK
ncbi:MAG: universal stress protein [Thermodesulfobacteriota bacterium]